MQFSQKSSLSGFRIGRCTYVANGSSITEQILDFYENFIRYVYINIWRYHINPEVLSIWKLLKENLNYIYGISKLEFSCLVWVWDINSMQQNLGITLQEAEVVYETL